jgi:hypothetical protein
MPRVYNWRKGDYVYCSFTGYGIVIARRRSIVEVLTDSRFHTYRIKKDRLRAAYITFLGPRADS